MTSIEDLKAHVGHELFDEARRWAWETADTGKSQSDTKPDWPKQVTDVPHDLCDLVWFDDELRPIDRVVLHFALYREMPCYANLMYASPDELDAAALDLFWQHIRELLNDADNRLADPVRTGSGAENSRTTTRPRKLGVARSKVMVPENAGSLAHWMSRDRCRGKLRHRFFASSFQTNDGTARSFAAFSRARSTSSAAWTSERRLRCFGD